MKQGDEAAGGAVPSANRITLLRDADGDGVAETAHVVPARACNSPFGMALVGDDALRRQHRRARALPLPRRRRPRSSAAGARVADLPGGPLNHHWTKNVIASPRRLEALRRRSARTATSPRTAWSKEDDRAAIWEIDPATGRAPRVRVRPAQPDRHGLGAGNRRAVDRRQRARRARQRPRARLHDVGARRRLLRLAVQLLRRRRRRARASRSARTSSRRRSCPTTRSARTPRRSGLALRTAAARCRRSSPTACSSASTARGTASRASGYKVIFVPFADGRPSGPPIDVLTGFLDEDGNALRPPGRRRDRQARRAAGRRRRRQRRLARQRTAAAQ